MYVFTLECVPRLLLFSGDHHIDGRLTSCAVDHHMWVLAGLCHVMPAVQHKFRGHLHVMWKPLRRGLRRES
jgi:hypothetical protein